MEHWWEVAIAVVVVIVASLLFDFASIPSGAGKLGAYLSAGFLPTLIIVQEGCGFRPEDWDRQVCLRHRAEHVLGPVLHHEHPRLRGQALMNHLLAQQPNRRVNLAGRAARRLRAALDASM